MEIDKFMIGMLVFSAIILTGTLVIGDINNNYPDIEMSTSDFSEVYDTTDQLYNTSQTMKGSILGGEVDDDNTENSMFRGVYSALRSVTLSFELFGDLVNAIAGTLGIPAFFITFGLAALALAITFALIYIIFRIAKG